MDHFVSIQICYRVVIFTHLVIVHKAFLGTHDFYNDHQMVRNA